MEAKVYFFYRDDSKTINVYLHANRHTRANTHKTIIHTSTHRYAHKPTHNTHKHKLSGTQTYSRSQTATFTNLHTFTNLTSMYVSNTQHHTSPLSPPKGPLPTPPLPSWPGHSLHVMGFGRQCDVINITISCYCYVSRRWR